MTSGVLVIDKAEGRTSRQLVDLARRALQTRKAGHLGTLDPFATGVLPVCLGRATRLARYLSGRGKVYQGEFRLGQSSDTLDRTGTILETSPLPPDLDQHSLAVLMRQFEGPQEQIAPMYSACKVDGQRLYTLARRGEAVERKPRRITIQRFALLELEGPLAGFRLECSAGTYVRALARDLGRKLGCGALVESLRRTAALPFSLAEAIPESELEGEGAGDRALARLIPLEQVPLGFPRFSLGGEQLERLGHGGPVPFPDQPPEPGNPEAAPEAGLFSVHTPEGELAAVARRAEGPETLLVPETVLLHG